MKKILANIVVCLLVLFFVFAPQEGRADEVGDLQTQIANIQAEQQKLLAERQQLQAQISDAEAKGNTLSATISALKAAEAKINNDLKITQSQINSANLTIEKLSLTISEKEDEVTDQKAALASGMRTLSDYDKKPLLLNMLTESNIAEAWQDADNLSSLENSLQSDIIALKAAETDLSKQKSDKQASIATLASLQSELGGQRETIQETQSAQAKLLAETKSQETAYQKLLSDNLAREQAFEQQLFDFQSRLKAPTTAAPAPEHGLLSFPLATIKVTQQFGKTVDSGRLYASGTHSGTDFGTPVGTPIMSAGRGVVAGMGNTDDEKGCYSYGRWLFITYDNGLSSIYGHLTSIVVKQGDSVAPGQVVGYSGGVPGAYGSGYSTGPHLHMGLFNTAGVSIQQYTSSIGCKEVSIPLANPTDYLDPLAYLPAL